MLENTELENLIYIEDPYVKIKYKENQKKLVCEIQTKTLLVVLLKTTFC